MSGLLGLYQSGGGRPQQSSIRLTGLPRDCRGSGAGMRTSSRFTVRCSDGPSARSYGLAGIVMTAVRLAGCQWQWDNNRRAVSVPIARTDDVAAALEAAGHVVKITGETE
jgi:hypothetical protein